MKKIAVISESSNFYARMLCEGIARKAGEAYDWELTLLDPDDNRIGGLDEFDGFIARVNTPRLGKLLQKTGKSVVDVFCTHHFPGFGIVDSDHSIAGRLAAEHFLRRNFHSFAYCGDGLDYLSRRQKAYVRCLTDNGHKVSVYKVNKGERRNLLAASYGGRTPMARHNSRMAQWLRRLVKPVGIFCAHDLMARQILNLCRTEGLNVPNEIAVLGCDNDPLLCSFGTPALSSLDLSPERIGIRAAEALNDMMAQKRRHPPAITIHPRGVVSRTSTESFAVELPWLAETLRYISENLTANLTTAALSRRVGRSHTTLDKAFRTRLTMTVRETVESFRIDKAKRLLASTNDKVESIAPRCGYPSVQHFCNLFRHLTGLTPIAYRDSFSTEF